MQEPQLYNDEEQEEAQRAAGDEEVLQYVPQADGAQGSEVVSVFGGRPDLSLGESSNGQDSGLQNRVWGFESLLPCQNLGVRKERNAAVMAELSGFAGT